jgi:hypothetical protein
MKKLTFLCAVLAVCVQSKAQNNSLYINSAGNVGIGTTAPNALVDAFNGVQHSDRIRLSGQEYFQAANSSPDGVAFRLGVNRAGNRQLWIADSASAINATNMQFQFGLGSGVNYAFLDAISTDVTTYGNLIFQIGGGNVGIGTLTPGVKLDVNGTVRAVSYIATITSGTKYADFVFKPGYKLASLSTIEASIKKEGHLPGIPGEEEARAHGIDLASMQVKLLQKVEELTLHVIEQQKELDALKADNAAMNAKNATMQARLNAMAK